MATVSTKIKEQIIEEMAYELEDRCYIFDRTHLRQIVTECVYNKNNLIDLFSKHPNWNPEKLIIQFDTDMERKIDANELYVFIDWLRYNADGKYVFNAGRQSNAFYVCNFISRIRNQFFDESMTTEIDKINSLNGNYKLRTNMKASKAIGKICREEGWDKLEGYNQKYAHLCDCLNPLKVKRHTCISLNPIDFLLMSNGNSWESCHYIGEYSDQAGCYSSGTISYMLDPHSFVFYTVDASYNGNQIEREPKIQRQIFGYNDEVIAQLRLYPQSNDCGAEKIYDDIRAIIQKVIADCLEKPNMWIKSTRDVEDVCHKGAGATCYPDWRYGNPGATHCCLSTHKERANGKEHRTIIFGAKPICISCGRQHSFEDNISCCHSGCEYCEDCGSRIDEDDVYWYDDRPYCYGCVTRCDECDEWIPDRYINEVDGYSICNDCLEENYNFEQCDHCGEWHHIDNLTTTEDGCAYCDYCATCHSFVCEGCGARYSEDAVYYDEETNEYYCKDCYDELIEAKAEEEVLTAM